MATQTTNYNLTKPDTTDYVDISVLNDNFDAIDAQMKSNADASEEAVTDVAYSSGTLKKTINGTTTDVFTADSTPIEDSTNPLTSGGAYTALAGKQDTLTFDSTPTSESSNPVTSGGVYTALEGKEDSLTFDSAPTESSTNPVTSGGVYTAVSAKQDTLTFDSAPTDGSSNPVTSDGIYEALDGKQDTLTFDTTPTASSTNPVTSGGVKTALNAKANLASPTFTGTPKAPTASTGTSTTQLASTAFVQQEIAANALTVDSALSSSSENPVQNKIINAAIASVRNNTPVVVSTVAEMTDTSRIYVYSGSESGYTAGNWYYYNGSAWTSGGVYGGNTVDSALNSASVNPVQNKVIYNELSTLNNHITTLENFVAYDSSWGKLQYFTQQGRASELVSVGDQITDTYTDPDASSTTTYSQVWDVLDLRNVTLSDSSTTPATIIGTHYTQLVSQQFSGWQALLYSETGLPAGTYNFTIDTAWGKLVVGTYQFTLANALPAGGQIVGVKKWNDTELANWTVSTYASATSTTAIETVAVTSGSDGTALGTVSPQVPTDTTTVTIDNTDYTYRLNGYHQAAYGYNRWKYSAVRQYLNSDAAAGEWWTPQHDFDRAPDIAATKAGWLAGCTDEFKAALTPVQVQTAIPTAIATAEGVDYDVTYDKVFLPSLEEHYIQYLITGEGDPYDYWESINGTETLWARSVATDALIMYALSNHTSATTRWLRSAARSYGDYEFRVNMSGYVSDYYAAYYSFTLAPVCAIC